MTHDKSKALDELIAAVESGGDPYHIDFFGPIDDLNDDGDLGLTARNAFFGSLDAAKALHEAMLPEHGYEVSGFADGGPFCASVWLIGHRLEKQILQRSINPARAWLIAILKAYRAQMDES